MPEGLTEALVEQGERPCYDTECDGIAEPELDGEHRYWECAECGFTFGYERVEGTKVTADSCAIGVPETVRRQFSGPMENEIKKEQAGQEALQRLRSLPLFKGS